MCSRDEPWTTLVGVVAVGLLVVAVALLLFGHRRVPTWVAVVLPVAVGLVTRVIELDEAGDAVRALDSSLAFLVVAVPLAVLLGRIGFFDAAAARVAVGARIEPALWVFAALVTTVFNLDAAIVLLTPLYIRIARRNALDPVRLAFQPVVLASLASSALPVSNLTNLIVADRIDAGTADFLWHLGPVSLLATTVGWFAYRRLPGRAAAPTVAEPAGPVDDKRAFRVGVPAVVALLVGFVAGDAMGIAPWMTAAAVAAVLVVVARHLPWRSVPWEAAVVATGLSVLASAAAPHLGLERVFGGSASALLAGIVGANAVNNLPALLVSLPYVDGGAVWALLAGVNLGPVFWVSGSLAGLLWLDIVRAHGLEVSVLDYAKVGLRVGLPAVLVASTWVLLV